ncbi:MAG: ATP synthase F0 sector subunit a, partial [uncultured Rubrobacteraceae bacterium]
EQLARVGSVEPGRGAEGDHPHLRGRAARVRRPLAFRYRHLDNQGCGVALDRGGRDVPDNVRGQPSAEGQAWRVPGARGGDLRLRPQQPRRSDGRRGEKVVPLHAHALRILARAEPDRADPQRLSGDGQHHVHAGPRVADVHHHPGRWRQEQRVRGLCDGLRATGVAAQGRVRAFHVLYRVGLRAVQAPHPRDAALREHAGRTPAHLYLPELHSLLRHLHGGDLGPDGSRAVCFRDLRRRVAGLHFRYPYAGLYRDSHVPPGAL